MPVTVMCQCPRNKSAPDKSHLCAFFLLGMGVILFISSGKCQMMPINSW